MKMGQGKKKVLRLFISVLSVFFMITMLSGCDDEDIDEFFEDEDEEESWYDGSPEDEEGRLRNGSSKHYAEIEPVSVGTDAKSATIMVYMNGSDLESKAGEATQDISEMLSSGIGDRVNVIIQTMGTKKWQDYGISSKTAQTYRIKDGELELLRDDLGQLDCTSKDTLSEFVAYCGKEFPADRYLFQFWDHGGGPVYGFGFDEWQGAEESLTIAEISEAFNENPDIHFDIIGMDCCIMADLETCYALAPYCKYTLLSEDFESGLGWSYKEWMKRFEKDPGMSTPVLGKYIVDSIIDENEKSMWGDSSCLGLFNESTITSLFSAWKNYAYRNEDALLGRNYSRMHRARGRSNIDDFDYWETDGSDVTLSDYYISDMLALVESVDSESDEAKSLMSALKACVAYYGHTSDKNELTGIAVSLPYGDAYFYEKLKRVYGSLGLDKDYIDWLGNFVSSSGNNDYYDYSSFEDEWGGWGAYEDEYGCSDGNCSNSWFYNDDGSYSDDFCDSGCYDYYDYGNSDSYDDWIYDYEEGLWYLYEDGYMYFYDDESDTTYSYDEYSDELYYYDEGNDEWYSTEW